MKLNSTEEIIEDIRQGKMVIIMDDENRENEGDLLMAASAVNADDVNFMARYGRGLICLTLTQERCQQLNLPLMVSGTNLIESTNFTLSIEAANGVTTGISAADRAVTIQAAVKDNAVPADIVQPGHIFPLMAQPGGVLSRAGHTEAGCDLVRLAGLEPSAMIVEILNEDGTMARRSDLELFAKQHELKIGTIDDLIGYRIKHEKTVERLSECNFPSIYGNFKLFAFRNTMDASIHYALVHTENETAVIDSTEPVLVRVHMKNILADSMGSLATNSWPLANAMKQISASKQGVLVLLSGTDEDAMVLQWMAQQNNEPCIQPKVVKKLRTDGVGAQILLDVGVRKMQLMTAPKVIHGLGGFGLEVVGYISGESTDEGSVQ